MEILIGLTMLILLPVAIVAVMHFKIGSYPAPLPKSDDKRKEIIEVLVCWFLAMAASTIYILQISPTELETPTAELQLGYMAYAVIPWLILPLAYVIISQK